MSNNKKHKSQKRIQELSNKYYLQLPGKYQEIEKCWKKYLTDLNDPASIETFFRLIHSLKGTAATFGFIKQADICFEIQQLLFVAKKEQSALSADSVTQIQQHLDELKIHINTPPQDIPE